MTEQNADMGWNDEEVEAAKKEAAERSAGGDQLEWLINNRSNGRNRYSLKAGTKGLCTIVQAAPLRFWEHQFTFGGSFFNFETALKGMLKEGDEDVLKQFSEPYRVWLFACIDHEPYVTKRGDTIEDRIKFIPAKLQSMDFFDEMKSEHNGDLFGLHCRVMRSNAQMSPAIGDTWLPKKVITRGELAKDFTEQMELVDKLMVDNGKLLRSIFAARTISELKQMYGSGGNKNETRPNKGYADPGNGAANDDDESDLPF